VVSIVPQKKGKTVVGFSMGWNMKGEAGRVEAKRERNRPRVGRAARQTGDIESVVVDENLPKP
jgi:hypothetical protein